MTMTYSLQALLRMREQNKSAAETMLREAIESHAAERDKLEDINVSIKETIGARKQLQRDFFLKAQQSTCNRREILCHVSVNQKSLLDETTLRQMRAQQEDLVRLLERKIELAKASVVSAHRDLKVIEKHYESWQQRVRKAEDIREEYRNDDQNSVRFMAKKG